MSAGATTTEYKGHTKLYVMVFILLGVLTVAELIAAEGGFPYAVKAISLTVLALGKAFAVAYWYMHLNEESKWLRFIAAIPISAGMYAVVLILETMFR
jgi:caa(3)-type oxidase subunit IV